jgi:hypothetical protein
MKRTTLLLLTIVAAIAASACQQGTVSKTNAAAPNTAANTAAANTAISAAPTKEALFVLERSAYDAWKNKDAKFWDGFLSAKFVGYGASGKLDKASATKEYAGADCDVKSNTLSDEHMTQLGPDAALITYKVTQDATCGGQKLPASSWAAGVYVREGTQWKGAFHAEAPIADPKAAPQKAPASATKPVASSAQSAPADAATDAMMALEKKAWEDWRNKDAKGLEAWAGSSLVSFTSNGRQDRAGAMKTWMEDGCQVKSVSLTDPSSVSLGPNHSMLLFKAAVDGKCGGASVPTEYGMSIYAKEGEAWKAAFTMGSPIQ